MPLLAPLAVDVTDPVAFSSFSASAAVLPVSPVSAGTLVSVVKTPVDFGALASGIATRFPVVFDSHAIRSINKQITVTAINRLSMGVFVVEEYLKFLRVE